MQRDVAALDLRLGTELPESVNVSRITGMAARRLPSGTASLRSYLLILPSLATVVSIAPSQGQCALCGEGVPGLQCYDYTV